MCSVRGKEYMHHQNNYQEAANIYSQSEGPWQSFKILNDQTLLDFAFLRISQLSTLEHSVYEEKCDQLDDENEVKILLMLRQDQVEKIKGILLDSKENQTKYDHGSTDKNKNFPTLREYIKQRVFDQCSHVLLKIEDYQEALQEHIKKSNLLFGDPDLPMTCIGQKTYIVSRLSKSSISIKIKNKLPGFTSLKESHFFMRVSSLCKDQQLKKYFKQSCNQILPKEDSKNKEIKQINGYVEFSNSVDCFIQILFSSFQIMLKFLQKHYCQLEAAISFSLYESISKKLDFQKLPNFSKLLANRMEFVEEALNLLPTQPNQLDQSENNAQSCAVQRESLYGELARKLETGDLLCLQGYWCPGLKEDLQELCSTWGVEKHNIIEEDVLKLFTILHDKITKQWNVSITEDTQNSQNKKIFNLFEYVYPGITAITELFRNKLRMDQSDKQKGEKKPKKKEKNIHPLDQIFKAFIEQQRGSNRILMDISNKSKMMLDEIIANLERFVTDNQKWVDVFNCLTLSFKKGGFSEAKAQNFLKELQYYRYPSLDCLACSKFFYFNYTNLLSPVKNSLIKIFPAIENINNYEVQVLEAICAMLNSNGGVIFFNCTRQYKTILPQGCLSTEKEKEATENKLKSMLEFVYPKPAYGIDIIVSFVPLALHPLYHTPPRQMQHYNGEQQQKPGQMFYKTIYLEGVYVTRIKVCPPKNSSTVFLHSTGDKYYLYNIANNEKMNQIQQLPKIIKRKFKNALQNERFKYRNPTFQSPLSHQCQAPDAGVILDSKKLASSQHSSLQSNYTHMSMLIIKQKYLRVIKDKLLQKGINCEIQLRFQTYSSLKSAVNTAILYHNYDPHSLVQVIKLPQFRFDDKNICVIHITNFVKIDQPQNIACANVRKAAEWLAKEFPRQKLRLYQVREEMYVETDSKLSALFVFHVLQSHGIKGALLKNPPNSFMKKTREERKKNEIEYVNNTQSLAVEFSIAEPPQVTPSRRQNLISLGWGDSQKEWKC